jgi:peptidyl-dipeptidase Dcp
MRFSICRLPLLALSLLMAGGSSQQGAGAAGGSAVLSADNPFAHRSTLPFGAEPMPQIKDSDFQPALEVGMAQELVEVDAIAENREEATFENTIVALDRSGMLLGRVNSLFQQLVGANTNDLLNKINEEETPKLQAHSDAILLNPKLFGRIRRLYDHRDDLGLNDKQKFLLSWQYRRFVHAGALLNPTKKSDLTAINEKIARLSNDYRTRLLAANDEAALLVTDKAELDGLSDSEVAAASSAAAGHGQSGKYLLVLRNTTQQPLLANLNNRGLRQRLLEAAETRGEHAGANDVRDIVASLAQLRAQKAQLMGFSNFAAFTQAEQMAKTPEASRKLLLDLVPAATRKARAEATEIQTLIDQQGGGFKLAAYDWLFYAEQVRKAKYAVDATEVRQYFELDRVLRDGVFFAAGKMYGLSFKERHDIPTYHPDMRVFEVFDADGSPLALFMLDPYARPNKNGGAWCNTLNVPSGLEKRKPIIVNTENFTKPAEGQPTLLSFDEVTTLFHEFGHALHAMFSVEYYPSESGFNMPTDVIEFPSQFNEHWALEPSVFANFAKHYQTSAAMPQPLVDRIKQARTYGKGYATTEYVAAALLDLEWHSLAANAAKQADIDLFEAAALKRDGVDLPEVPPRYRTPYFLHIWANGYEANYYAYMWGEILDDDAYEWFTENGGMTRANGQKFRDNMLGRGFTDDPMAIYRGFRGRDPSAEAIKRERGLE